MCRSTIHQQTRQAFKVDRQLWLGTGKRCSQREVAWYCAAPVWVCSMSLSRASCNETGIRPSLSRVLASSRSFKIAEVMVASDYHREKRITPCQQVRLKWWCIYHSHKTYVRRERRISRSDACTITIFCVSRLPAHEVCAYRGSSFDLRGHDTSTALDLPKEKWLAPHARLLRKPKWVST